MSVFTNVVILVNSIIAVAVLLFFGTVFIGNFIVATNNPTNKNVSENNYLDPNGPNVQFLLFQRYRKVPYNFKTHIQGDFNKSRFSIEFPTKIIIHGFLSSTREPVFTLNRNAYLTAGNYNVIGMDWSVLCEFEYFTAMRGAQIAGITLGNFINWLIKEGVEHRDIHLIGHSLGAHVAAMAAVRVQGGKIARITGLDPAAPGYTTDVSSKYRLDVEDALLVDVIHTNVRVLSLAETQGHLDFYPNGGRFQPGCPDMYAIWTFGESVECNHGRAYIYFAETIINRRGFRSYRCSTVQHAILGQCSLMSDVHMGQEETYTPGIYYLKTASQPPYAL